MARASPGFAVLASLDGKTAIVTGASSGIGAATAHALAEAGARVAVGARRVESLPDREGFYAFDLDVTDRASVSVNPPGRSSTVPSHAIGTPQQPPINRSSPPGRSPVIRCSGSGLGGAVAALSFCDI